MGKVQWHVSRGYSIRRNTELIALQLNVGELDK